MSSFKLAIAAFTYPAADMTYSPLINDVSLKTSAFNFWKCSSLSSYSWNTSKSYCVGLDTLPSFSIGPGQTNIMFLVAVKIIILGKSCTLAFIAGNTFTKKV